MAIDLTDELVAALCHPRVGAALEQRFKAIVAEALAEKGRAQAEEWIAAKEAARYIYGVDGKEEAFRALRHRHPELDRTSNGRGGKLRRWKRADLRPVRQGPLTRATK